ncbi:MAG: isoprenylcysteine carboxylmethyltransferase family protein [Anaerolineae bacterium]|nr:isoprenylcysteine carboxylmethyltransferase family protein [Anaerolineae bacterium]
MKSLRAFIYNLHPYALCCISAPLTVVQIVLAFVLHQPGSEVLRWIGWVLWWTSAVFGWLPILTFRRRGGVAKGKSYVHTTRLVETGIYAIVRHPQMGTAWLLMCVALMLITQHWISVVLGVPAMVLAYVDLLKADQCLVVKFGDAYRRYMERVPRVNFVAGIIQLARHRIGG